MNKKSNKKNKTVALSKALSWITRHGAPKLNLPISTDGYIPVKAILKCQARNMHTYSVEDILHVVETNDKQRFKLCQKHVMWETRGKEKRGSKNISTPVTVEECYTFVDGNDDDNDTSDIINEKKASSNSNENSRKIVLELCIRANQVSR